MVSDRPCGLPPPREPPRSTVPPASHRGRPSRLAPPPASHRGRLLRLAPCEPPRPTVPPCPPPRAPASHREPPRATRCVRDWHRVQPSADSAWGRITAKQKLYVSSKIVSLLAKQVPNLQFSTQNTPCLEEFQWIFQGRLSKKRYNCGSALLRNPVVSFFFRTLSRNVKMTLKWCHEFSHPGFAQINCFFIFGLKIFTKAIVRLFAKSARLKLPSAMNPHWLTC